MLGFLKNLLRPTKRPPGFLSFDVEALPLRAHENAVAELIWGKTPEGDFGIRRICGILRGHGLRANFLVDMAAAVLYGDAAVREVTDYLLGEGHEVHAHLHPELLADRWCFKKAGIRERRMAEFGQRMSDAMTKFSAVTYSRLTGKQPFLFRSGSYQFNRHTISGARKAGFRALSNYNAKKHLGILPFEHTAARMDPFRWTDEDIVEIPVDISSPEKSKWRNFLAHAEETKSKPAEKTCNLVFHSWSLLRRDENGHHREFGPELEKQFHEICVHMKRGWRVMGYGEYLAEAPVMPDVASNQCMAPAARGRPEAAQCPDCGAIVAVGIPNHLPCPGCPGGNLIPLSD